MNWYGITREASWGHEDTLEGQYMRRLFREVRDEVDSLRKSAYHGGPAGVLPRWKGQLRQRILLLPPEPRIRHMSMHELKQLRESVDDIRRTMRRYSLRRFTEIFNADQKA